MELELGEGYSYSVLATYLLCTGNIVTLYCQPRDKGAAKSDNFQYMSEEMRYFRLLRNWSKMREDTSYYLLY